MKSMVYGKVFSFCKFRRNILSIKTNDSFEFKLAEFKENMQVHSIFPYCDSKEISNFLLSQYPPIGAEILQKDQAQNIFKIFN